MPSVSKTVVLIVCDPVLPSLIVLNTGKFILPDPAIFKPDTSNSVSPITVDLTLIIPSTILTFTSKPLSWLLNELTISSNVTPSAVGPKLNVIGVTGLVPSGNTISKVIVSPSTN